MVTCDVLVIGGGPAGLRAAELTSAAGLHTILADRMPSVGRKFLVAGKGGLNLTHSEPLENFVNRYGDESRWRSLLDDFSPADLRAWADGLGVETFVGTSGRVFPATKQAAPLLRRWIARLKKQGVDFRMRHDWKDLLPGPRVSFETLNGKSDFTARAVVLALGGGSWPQTGSNAAWLPLLQKVGVEIAPLTPANCGYEVDWPASFLEQAEGRPLKNIVAYAGAESVAGELLITRYGLEGGALYQLDRTLRGMDCPALILDLKPAFTAQQLADRLNAQSDPSPESAARAWKLSAAANALLRLCPRPFGQRACRAGKELSTRVARAATPGGSHLQRGRRGLDRTRREPAAAPAARRFLRGGDDRLGRADRRLPSAGLFCHGHPRGARARSPT